MQKTKWWEESPGVMSSKRIFGGALVAMGVAMKLTLFVVAMFGAIGDPATASAQAASFLYTGGVLLGITGLDVFKAG